MTVGRLVVITAAYGCTVTASKIAKAAADRRMCIRSGIILTATNESEVCCSIRNVVVLTPNDRGKICTKHDVIISTAADKTSRTVVVMVDTTDDNTIGLCRDVGE